MSPLEVINSIIKNLNDSEEEKLQTVNSKTQ
jgi:hypothetical protein